MVFSLPDIVCRGTPEQIGLAHGTVARDRIHLSILNYSRLFNEMANLTWEGATKLARTFIDALEQSVPEIVEEMRGIAIGAGVDFLDILTLNLRSEIALTAFSDGCTSIAQALNGGLGEVFIAQNWDWVGEAANALVLMDIERLGTPRIRMLGEAGLVGKFGFNSAGVGVCMNAILAEGLDKKKLPVHIAIRKSLECSSFEEALTMLNYKGVSSTVNLVIGDSGGNIGTIECSPFGNTLIPPRSGTVCHTNHLYAQDRPVRLKDRASENSFSRLERIYMLAQNKLPSFESIREHLSDEDGTPTAICRAMPPNAVGMQRTETLATIIIDLKALRAEVSLGRPSTLPLIKTLSLSDFQSS